MEIGIVTYVDCEIIEEGSIVVNSRIFGDIVKKLPQSNIEISSDNQDFKMNILCEKSEFNILGSNPEEYPELPTIIDQTKFKIPRDLFKTAIRQTVFATSQDETRPILTGVLLEVKGGLGSFVSLDGYRLALKRLKINTEADFEVVIPSKALVELSRILEDSEEEFEVVIAANHVIFNLGDTLFSSRLLEGQFLNYRDIIREDHNTGVIVNKSEFQSSIERASLLAKEEKANLIKFTIEENTINIESNSEIGNVHEEINCKIEGETLKIAFNARYIIEGIKALETENIRLNFAGSLSPCIINALDDDNYTYLVLPVRIAQDEY